MGHVWADEGTHSGPDSDPMFDEDDELVFMARQLGVKKPDGFILPPNGVVNVSKQMINFLKP